MPNFPKPSSTRIEAVKPWYLLPEKPAEGLLTPEEWVAVGSIFGLTGRELNVAILIFEDRTRASMARKLSRSPGGIRKRVDKVFQKMKVTGKLGLVQRVWQVHRSLFSGEKRAFVEAEARGHKDAPCDNQQPG
jgi:DNA-binding CsgD family transcriptional regulator